MREILEQIFLGLAIGIPLFLMLRVFFLWYFKIDKRVELLESIREELTKGE